MRGATTVLLLAFAVLLQAAVVNRLPLPWGSAPDLVVLTVVAIALGATPVSGALAGFSAGLALDVLPPADHEIGRYALVLCLAGYVVGKLHDSPWRSRAWPYLVAFGAALGVALGFATLGLVLGTPHVGGGTFLFVVPINVGITMLVSPVVLAPVRRLRRYLANGDLSDITDTPWATGGIRL
ncbi:rod shape-determining protein MreD [Lipingzhangella halophila]|uniref:Rod shape-determining protein MreD n=1 Tax=Lipingzhangella halophila TaxID=1783352 RepID=A0A7W7RKI3_9ACTN|nr:rod shape-determining protein MreD [Lipingzhangella halophila]MBB4933206.1 rod shape-determining protein MreD [Lipingzhangella halophila]